MTSKEEKHARRSILTAGIFCMAVVILCGWLMGCAGNPITEQRSYGQKMETFSWYNVPSEEYYFEEFEIKNLKVRFYHPAFMPPCGGCYNAAGCAGGDFINIIARKTPHGLMPIQWVMGHEFLHILEQAGYPVVNPDQYESFGY